MVLRSVECQLPCSMRIHQSDVTLVWPEKAVGIVATEAIRGKGGILLN
jgi:hypothetical protein